MDPREFKRVAQAALDDPSAWLPALMGGRQKGHEWVGERTRNGGIGDSWSFNLQTGLWSHFGGTETGNDAISLVAAVLRVNQGAAYDWLARQLGAERASDPHVRVLPRRAAPEPPEEPCEPIPELAPDPDWGKLPTPAIYRYGRDFWITRHDLEDGAKTFRWWTWRAGRWAPNAPPKPWRLFHVELLDKDPCVPVLLVEGEKCALAAQSVLTKFDVVTWPGGVSNWKHANWAALKNRNVIIWPDNDPVGIQAGTAIGQHLARIAASVSFVPAPETAPEGWDIADAISEGWTLEQIVTHIRAHKVESIPETITKEKPFKAKEVNQSAPKLNGHHTENPPVSQIAVEPFGMNFDMAAYVDWPGLGLDCHESGKPIASIGNAALMLQRYHGFAGKLWFDTFRQRIYHCLRNKDHPEVWTDKETRDLTVAVQTRFKLSKFTLSMIETAVQQTAENSPRNSLTDWLEGLKWDGNERLNTWLADCLGLELTDYTMAVSRNWPIALIARAYQPGCKMDNMPVLEGRQGLHKTTFLETLGGEWYKALPMDFGSKDFLQCLQGAWVVEIPDMTGFSRVAHSAVISMLTIRADNFRAPYARHPQEHLRTCVFAGTSERDDYLSDARGQRRYWPLTCTEINLDTLRQQRDRIFAEALIQYRSGATWHEVPQSAAEEQAHRVFLDPWQELLEPQLPKMWELFVNSGMATAERITNGRLLSLIGVDTSQHFEGNARRVSAIMKALGYHTKRTSTGSRWWLKNPPP